MKGEAVVRLAELRRRQGRLAEAAALVEQVAPHGSGLLVRAWLAWDCGDPRAALELAEQYLRHLPAANRTERASGLEIAIQARTNLQDWQGAARALDELTDIGAVIATLSLRADVSFASGYVAMGKGNADAARRYFEDACDLYARGGAPFETGRTQMELARALGALGRVDAALETLRRAKSLLYDLHAEVEVARAERLIASLLTQSVTAEGSERKAKKDELTKREIEVLRLVAEGLSNDSIAERLFVSDHTVHRHLANILNKLDVNTRAAAVAQAARRGLLT
jgi:ATP/maltotriose-dependent transcriptional regulator MalT